MHTDEYNQNLNIPPVLLVSWCMSQITTLSFEPIPNINYNQILKQKCKHNWAEFMETHFSSY